MLKEEKILNHDLPQELREAPIWVCARTEHIEKETLLIAYDPTTGESVDVSDPTNLMPYEDAHDLKENAPDFANAGTALVLRKEDPYISIAISNAVNSDSELSEVARKSIDTLKGEFYGWVEGASLVMIVKGDTVKNQQFKNIKVNYSSSNHLVPINGHATWKPNTPWVVSTRLDEIKQYHFKMNCQVDENSEQLPEHYVKTNSGLRLLPNVLVSILLQRRDYLVCNSMIYARKKGRGIFQKVNIDEIELEILDYLSPKYLTNRDIEDVKKLLLKRIPKDEGLTDPNRMKGKINFKNGVYDIETGTFGPYESHYHTAFQLNVDYEIDAQCPRFLEYIKVSLSEDDVKTVQEMIGYLATTDIKAQKAFILYGPGNTGKSVLIDVIERIIGYDYVSNIPFQDLGAKFSTVRLFGKLLNSYSDLPQGSIKDTGIFKSLVSGDSIHGEDKFEKGFDFRNTARFLFATNKLPSNFVDQSTGFYRRLILIPFQNVVSKENIDRDLNDVLFQEREGIVQWALVGLRRLIKNNHEFTESEDARKLMGEYKKSNNSVLFFADECCQLDPVAKISGKVLYDAYKKACLDARLTSVSQREFNVQIVSQFGHKGVSKYQGSQSRAVEFAGIKIK
ncbi:phage/plasmid primase, P4 family [Bacillus sp. REN16]|uniref:phage/plasmid primase, P4 family n=1 Tax=Bacillus sp. REN16 TaxID=2887296 RepID=UPI001E432645|nr:phage/plasmid primase, P4 family [Bacillus sp. REN16]MCC3359418.1 phage/plasmid primase, P4 family [Bacillus sp. REN16]